MMRNVILTSGRTGSCSCNYVMSYCITILCLYLTLWMIGLGLVETTTSYVDTIEVVQHHSASYTTPATPTTPTTIHQQQHKQQYDDNSAVVSPHDANLMYGSRFIPNRVHSSWDSATSKYGKTSPTRILAVVAPAISPTVVPMGDTMHDAVRKLQASSSSSTTSPSTSASTVSSTSTASISSNEMSGVGNGRYVYKLFYENFDSTISCSNQTTGLSMIVGIQGYISEEVTTPIATTSSSSSSPINTNCIDATSCVMNPYSSECLALQQQQQSSSTSSSSFSYTINPRDRRIFSCDASYYNCVQLGLLSCLPSEYYPQCNYVLALPTDIIENPSIIQSFQQQQSQGNVSNSAILAIQEQQLQQSYQIFYSDANCANFVGIRGLTKGENVIPGFHRQRSSFANNSTSISCYDAMSCLLNPGGTYCTSIGGADGAITFLSDTHNGTVRSCNITNPAACVTITDRCFQYPHYPMCSIRWVSATSLFTNPSKYIYTPTLETSSPTIQQQPVTSPHPAPTTTVATIAPTPSLFVPDDKLQDYGYIILYTEQNCWNNSAVMIHPIVLGEHMKLNGRLSPTDSCLDEAICVVKSSKSRMYDIIDDQTNRTCSSMDATDVGSVFFLIPPNSNSINQCNNRFGNDTCAAVDTCIFTGLMPSCNLVVVKSSEIQQAPNKLLRNSNYQINTNHNVNKFMTNDTVFYQIFYSDNSCSNFVALNGMLLPTGKNETISTISDPSIDCHDAVACIINPKSIKCKQLLLDNGLSNNTVQLFVDPKNPTKICNNNGFCEPVIQHNSEQQKQCIQSTALSSCYTKIVPASMFFDNPRRFIAKNSPEETTTLTPSRSPKADPIATSSNSDTSIPTAPTPNTTFLPTVSHNWNAIYGFDDDDEFNSNHNNYNISSDQDSTIKPLTSSSFLMVKFIHTISLFTVLLSTITLFV